MLHARKPNWIGKHQGKGLEDVPTSYLAWALNECNLQLPLRSAMEGLKRMQPPAPAQDPICQIPVASLKPALQNNLIYKPVDPNDPDLKALAESIRRQGVLDPLVITVDDVILSGHRRLAASKRAGLRTVPCRREAIHST